MQTLVAVYPSRSQAEDAKAKLMDYGIPGDKIALSPESGATMRQCGQSSGPMASGNGCSVRM